MLLFLVRHAETDSTGKVLTGWMPGHHLSARGMEQAEEVAGRLADLRLHAVYSSPLERCRETAAAIAARHGLNVEPVDDLGEVRYGGWQGKSLKSLYRTKAWREMIAGPADFRFPQGESIREAQTRAMTAAQALLARHRGKAVVAVSHADIIRLLVAGFMGLGVDLYQRTSIYPASVTVAQLGDRIPRLLSVGSSASFGEIAKRLERPPAKPAAGRQAR